MNDHTELSSSHKGEVLFIRDIIEFVRQNSSLQSVTTVNCRKSILNFIQKRCNSFKWNSVQIKLLEDEIVNFSLILSRKWSNSCRKIDKFNTLNNDWLNSKFKIPTLKPQPSTSNAVNLGRPSKMFTESSESSERIKRRKMNDLITSSNMTSPEIMYACNRKIQQSGQRNVARILKKVTSSPNTVLNIKNVIKKLNSTVLIPYTTDEALAFFVENDLTKQQYINIRLSAKNRNADIYPPYNLIIKAKKLCCPDSCIISETRCEIKLQNLLNHTSLRIFQIPTVESHNKKNLHSFEISYKWGCDGSNGQSSYKQMYKNPNVCMDSDLFMISIVPLRLQCLNEKNEKHVLWKNNRTSSTRYCRPIMFDFKKETIATTLLEVDAIEDQIKKLNSPIVLINNIEIAVTHKLVFTMVDGKVCNSITNTSSQICYICGSKHTQMNDIVVVSIPNDINFVTNLARPKSQSSTASFNVT